MESWRLVWRNGVVPQLTAPMLEALGKALLEDDKSLLQGATTKPPPLLCVQDWACEGADCLGYLGWKGAGLKTVGQVEEFFAKTCLEADNLLGVPAGIRWFLNWFDDTPRAEMRHELLSEVELAMGKVMAQVPVVAVASAAGEQIPF